MAREPRRRSTRKKTSTKKAPAAIKLRVLKHIEHLGFESPRAYQAWCRDVGIDPSTDKTTDELALEVTKFEREQARRKAIERIDRDPTELIEKACAATLDIDRITRPNWRAFAWRISEYVPHSVDGDVARDLLLAAAERSDFLYENTTFGDLTTPYVSALIRVASWHKHWIAPLGEWQIDGHSHRRHFGSLVRHLFASYPVPEFLDSVWFRDDDNSYHLRNLYIDLGAGKKLSGNTHMPVPMTKRMLHLFMQAPASYTVEHAIRWAEVHALGGSPRLVEAVLPTRLGRELTNHQFWRTVLSFFIANPMLDRQHVGPIVDFINFQKFDAQEVMIAPGVVEREGPPHPGFSMRGRSPEALLRQVDDWHQEIGYRKAAAGLFFKKSGIKPFERKCPRTRGQLWRITELLSGTDLIAEGKALNHCVATYADSCTRESCSIWSMETVHHQNVAKHVTIEVSRYKQIVQVRGHSNRLPSMEEFQMIKSWAHAEGLTVSNHLLIDDDF